MSDNIIVHHMLTLIAKPKRQSAMATLQTCHAEPCPVTLSIYEF